MKQKVMLSLRGTQAYRDQEPQVIELITEGEMEFCDGGWDIRYEESDLTGLEGVHTAFRIEKDQVTLTRTGALNSCMVFKLGQPHDSLYQMEFGALMLRVCASHLFFDITPEGGVVDLVYSIEIENTEAGQIDYHLLIRKLED